jgi:Cell division protein SepF
MPQQAVHAIPDPGSPRMVVIREFGNAKAVTAMLRAGRPVFVVLRAGSDDRRRVLDLLAGWALGSGGDLDRIGPNTVLARPAHSGPVRLGRAGMVSAVDEVFMIEGPHALGRDEEERLLPLAATGSVSAQRRIVDSYAELATLFALRVRPRWTSETRAVQVAQEELDRLVRCPPKGALLASLVEGITKRLGA